LNHINLLLKLMYKKDSYALKLIFDIRLVLPELTTRTRCKDCIVSVI